MVASVLKYDLRKYQIAQAIGVLFVIDLHLLAEEKIKINLDIVT